MKIQCSIGLALATLIQFSPATATFVSAAAASAGTQEQLVFFGTYTGARSKGIYVSRMDASTGRLGNAELAAESSSPSFLAVSPNGKFLYAVNEASSPDGKSNGAVTAYSIDRSTGKLTLLNHQPSIGGGPCHIVADKQGKHVVVANYGGGSTIVLPIQADGRLGSSTAFIQHKGSSVNPQRQQAPHAHCATLDAANRFAFIADLGLDQILIFKFDSNTGSLTPNSPPFASVKPGAGPRHFSFTPSNNFGYVINELDCTITAFSYDAGSGRLTSIESVSTLPAGESVKPGYSTAEIEVHPTGKFVYGSNRGHNTIAAFAIDSSSGKLTLIEHESTQGKTPRNFAIDPTGRWLLAANQDTDNVVVFGVDQKTGKLEPTGHSIKVGVPVCVAYLPLR